ncbi:MAG: hypothetical protein U9O82_04140 [Thermodesulfobacteriota bacterium]|nr:hypothetical protein [Thermodesulfobacteriota bacterium]
MRRRRKNIFYYQTQNGSEVDFITAGGYDDDNLIRVCHDMQHIETIDREKRALIKGIMEPAITSSFFETSLLKSETSKLN